MDSPLAAALEQVGDRWTLQIVEGLLEGPSRFADLQTTVKGIAPNVLSQRLKHLEREQILLARPYSERPVRLAYELTPLGKELAGALHMLSLWGARREGTGHAHQHETCGTPLESVLWCPTCSIPVTPGDADVTEL